MAVNQPGVNVRLYGDEKAAQEILPRAFLELSILDRLMSFQKLKNLTRTVKLANGAVIFCHRFFKQAIVSVFHPVIGAVKEAVPDRFIVFVLEDWRFAHTWPEEDASLWAEGFDYRYAMLTPVLPGPHRVYYVMNIETKEQVYLGIDYAAAVASMNGAGATNKTEYEFTHSYIAASADPARWQTELGYSTLAEYAYHRCGTLRVLDETDHTGGYYYPYIGHSGIPVVSHWDYEYSFDVNYEIYPNEGDITVFTTCEAEDIAAIGLSQTPPDPEYLLIDQFSGICPAPSGSAFPAYNQVKATLSGTNTTDRVEIRNYGDFSAPRFTDPGVCVTSTTTPAYRIRGAGIQHTRYLLLSRCIRVPLPDGSGNDYRVVYVAPEFLDAFSYHFSAEANTDIPVRMITPVRNRVKAITDCVARLLSGNMVDFSDAMVSTTSATMITDRKETHKYQMTLESFTPDPLYAPLWFGVDTDFPEYFAEDPPVCGDPPLPPLTDDGLFETPVEGIPQVASEMTLRPYVRSSDLYHEQFKRSMFDSDSTFRRIPHSFVLAEAMFSRLFSETYDPVPDPDVQHFWNRTYHDPITWDSLHDKQVFWWSSAPPLLQAVLGYPFDVAYDWDYNEYIAGIASKKDAFYDQFLKDLETYELEDDPGTGRVPYIQDAATHEFYPRIFAEEYANIQYGTLVNTYQYYGWDEHVRVDTITDTILPGGSPFRSYSLYDESHIWPTYPDTIDSADYHHMQSDRVQVVRFRLGTDEAFYCFFGGPSANSFKFEVFLNGVELDGDTILEDMVSHLQTEHSFDADENTWLYNGYWTARIHGLYA